MTIVPIRDLKDTVKIENLCSANKEPVFITKNGYGKLVIMDIAFFEEVMNELYIAKSLKEGLDDVKEGKLHNGPSVLDELKTKYGL